MALLGATDVQVAGVLGVSIKTVEYWKREKPEFLEALNRGKMEADSKVAEALYNAAIGYDYEEDIVSIFKGEVTKTRVKRYKHGNPWASARWLSIRQRSLWHESQSIDITNRNIHTLQLDLTAFSTEELTLLKRLGMQQPNSDEPITDATIIPSTD